MADNNNKCQNAEPFFYEYFHGSTESIPDNVIKHIENCSSCLEAIDSMKDIFEQTDDDLPADSKHAILTNKLSRHFSFIEKPVTCSNVKPFMSELADPTIRITVPTPITVHIQHCQQCSRDMDLIKSLHMHSEALANIGHFLSQKAPDNKTDNSNGLLNGILTRPDSKVVTIFSIDKSVDISPITNGDGSMDKWPITVKVLQQGSETLLHTEQKTQKRKRAIPFFKTGIAAAIIFFTFILFPGTAPSIDVSLGQMYQALDKMENFHMVAISPDTGNVIHQKWVANSLGVMLIEQQGQTVLWDVNAATMKTDSLETKQLSKEVALGIKKTMEPSGNLLPFPYLSKIPEHDWKKVELTQSDVELSGTEIYDLVWTKDTSLGQKITNRSRCYVDMQLRVPRRTELWKKEDGKFKLHGIFEISYPDRFEIDKMITAKMK